MDPRTAPERLRLLPSWLLAQAGAQTGRLVDEQLAADGWRRRHFATLAALVETGPSSQADLGRRVGLDRSDVTATLTELEGQGLVQRELDPANRRRNLVRATEAGEKRLEEIAGLVDSAQDEALSALNQAERTQLVRLLTKLLG